MMTRKRLWLTAAAAVSLGLYAGCERNPETGESTAKEAGRDVGKAAHDVGSAVRDAAKGFEEGIGGSGAPDGGTKLDVGRHPGVLNDGEGPIEER